MNATTNLPDLLVNVQMPRVMSFEGHAGNQDRQRQLLRAANSLQITAQWGVASEAALRRP
jgi:hypothetical protein